MKVLIKRKTTQETPEADAQSAPHTPLALALSPATHSQLPSIRQNALHQFNSRVDYLADKQIAEIETTIYDAAVSYANKCGTSTKCDNPSFQSLYNSLVRHWLINLDKNSYIKNSELSDRLINGSVTVSQLINMTPRETMPSRWASYEEHLSAEIRVITRGELVATTELFTCSRCKKNICSYYQLQSRSIDEGATNYITCNSCGHKWKQHN